MKSQLPQLSQRVFRSVATIIGMCLMSHVLNVPSVGQDSERRESVGIERRADFKGRIFVWIGDLKRDKNHQEHLREGSIYAIDPDSGKKQVIVENAHSPFVTRDGRTLSYWTAEGYMARAADGTTRRLLEPKWDDAILSTDGKEVVYSAILPDGSIDSWRRRLDGGKPQKIRIEKHDRILDWSADGKWFLIFRSTNHDRDQPRGLYVVRTNGADESQLTKDDHTVSAARFSPDGKRVLFVQRFQYWLELHSQIQIVDLRDRSTILIRSPDPVKYHPCWSPDGKRYAYAKIDSTCYSIGVEGECDVDSSKMWIAALNGGKEKTIIGYNKKWIGEPYWR